MQTSEIITEVMMRVAFFGNSPSYSDQFADALVKRSNNASDPVTLVAIVCPQRNVSRRPGRQFQVVVGIVRAMRRLLGRRVQQRVFGDRGGIYLALQHHASKAGVPVLYPAALDEVLAPLADLRPDVCVVAGLNRILKPHVIDRLPAVYNIHPSLLPDYRGGAPEFWELADGVNQGGVTMHRIDPGIDTGPIVLQRDFTIPPWIDVRELTALSVQSGLALLDEFLDGYPAVTHRSAEQTGPGSYRPFPAASEQIAPFASGARAVFNRARAYGWEKPLIVHIDRAAWHAGRTLAAIDPSESTLALHLFDPVPFHGQTGDSPGTLHRTITDGVVLTCQVGTVLFRRAHAA